MPTISDEQVERLSRIGNDLFEKDAMASQEIGEILTSLQTPPAAQEGDADKDALWQMVAVQDKPEDEAAFMVNYLRGSIKIPQEVRTRIYWMEHEKKSTLPHPHPTGGEVAEAVLFLRRNMEANPDTKEFMGEEIETLIKAAQQPAIADKVRNKLERLQDVMQNGGHEKGDHTFDMLAEALALLKRAEGE